MNFIGTGKRLTPRDFGTAAAQIKVPVATMQGVVDVEAQGRGFDAARRPKILPEPHIFYARLGKGAARDKAVKAGVAYPKWGQRPYPKTSDANYARLAVMISIHERIAIESTSWGLPQIMGFNHADAGFADARDMVEAFLKGEAEQLKAFVTLITSWGLDDELRRRDARGFALRYNGKGFDKNDYDGKLIRAWRLRDKGQKAMPAAAVSDGVPTDVRGPAPAQEPVTVPIGKASIIQVQTRLKELGYGEVGIANGDYGPRTQAAITAFRIDNDLEIAAPNGDPLGIDDDLLAALATGKHRPVSEERANATVADLRADGSRVVAGADQAQVAGGVGAAIPVVGYGAKVLLGDGEGTPGVLDKAEEVSGYWYRVQSVLEPLQGLATWVVDNLLIVVPIGLAAIYIAHRIKRKRLAEHKAGKVQ